MCQTTNRDLLRNGHAADSETQGHALADIIDGLGSIEKRLGEIPTRSEVREMIHDSLRIHVESCDAARDDGQADPNKLEFGLGKILGLKAEGRVGSFLVVLLWVAGIVAVILSIPHVAEWLGFWGAK